MYLTFDVIFRQLAVRFISAFRGILNRNIVIHLVLFSSFPYPDKSFWVDNQARESDIVDDDSVPLYDREFTLGSTPLGDSSNTER
jgi:hypothetical protein